MADKRISQLVERVDIANNDVVPIVASGATTTNKATISSIQTFMQENLDVGVTSVGITIGTSGTDVSVTGSPVTTSGNITINLPTASATNRGLLSAADWTTFNNKADAGNYVTLDTAQTITAQKTFTTSGSTDSVIISHGSGSGIALDVIKAGSGQAIRVQKTSGSGDAVTITGGLLSAEDATFSSDIIVNGVNVGKGGGSLTTNTRIGVASLSSNTTGNGNTANGAYALENNTTGSNNTAVGQESLENNIVGAFNTAIGFQALQDNTSSSNTAIGHLASLQNTSGSANFSGGARALENNTTGSVNTSIGFASLQTNTTGGGNVALGEDAGRYTSTGTGNTNGGDSVFIGRQTKPLGDSQTNQIVIGYQAIGNGSNTVTIGNDSITNTYLKGAVTLTGALSGTSASFSGLVTSSNIINSSTLPNTPSNHSISLYPPTTTNYYGGGIGWSEGTNTAASINAYDDGGGGALGLVLSTGNNSTITPRLTIASTGAATFSSSVECRKLYVSPAGGAGSGSDGIANIQTTSSTLGQTSELGLLIKNNGTSGYYSQIGFGYAESKVGAVIAGLITNSGGATSSALVFGTRSTTVGSDAPVERMRITSGGYLKAKANGGNYFNGVYHEFVNNNNVSGDRCLVIGNKQGSNTNNTSSATFTVADLAGDRLYIYGNGNVVNVNNSYGSLSDIKLKENITDASPKLDDLLKVKIRNYNLIGEETKQIGVIAQELEEVFPAMIDESEDFEDVEVPQLDEEGNEVLNEEGEVVTTKERVSKGTTTKSVKYSVFVPMLIKAIQEQQEIINEIKSEIDSLKNQIK
jgi:hypothetical protein